MKLAPLADRVALKQLEAEEKTKSGIILSAGSKEKPIEGIVIAVGPGTKDVKMELKEGDRVVYSKYAGTEVKVDEEEYILIKQSDVLAVIKK